MFLALVTITGVALIIGFEQWLAVMRDVATRNPKQAGDQIAYVIRVFAAVISLSLAGLALVVARVSWQVYAARRFPPPGMNLAFDVRVVEGLRAVWRALAGFVTAMLLGAMAVVMPYLLWRILSLIVPAPSG
jgi:hypothetical protein